MTTAAASPALLARRPSRRGFTLIELIVTIVILGVLAALAVPAFSAVIERSHKSALEQSGLAVGRELAAYAAFDSEGFASGSDGATEAHVRAYLDEMYELTYDPSNAGTFVDGGENAPVFGPAAGTSLVGGTASQFQNHTLYVVDDADGDGAPAVGDRCMLLELPAAAGGAPQVAAPAEMTWQGDWDGCTT